LTEGVELADIEEMENLLISATSELLLAGDGSPLGGTG
jgi:hypothetical protein